MFAEITDEEDPKVAGMKGKETAAAEASQVGKGRGRSVCVCVC